MKQILITALYFISLINAADDQKEIELKLGDGLSSRIFKGYALNKMESTFLSFIGIHQVADNFTIVRAEYRKDKDCIFGDKGGFEEYTFSHRFGGRDSYACWDGYHYRSQYFDDHDARDSDDYKRSMAKALSLCNFYIKIHAQRALGIEKNSVQKDKEPKE